ncbi:hypothetical protein IFT84_17640 [Rhizobium sp. CFBP 8762]|uniref:hypothetical protein n=1 Tax=Rhizobium sp. CFBP 8762 TaxID=2775279 RepID=UPI00177B3737|nr:hypothetical protein [Rhizobium sp. CFBP 8762]MBD8556334.1 hypothetical protein [Rhizobium sp. CFBP 8762]
MGRAEAFIVGSTDTLIIKSKLSCGRVWTHSLEQKPRTQADIQNIIDSFVDDREVVTAVWMVELDKNGVPTAPEDMTDRFDVRTVDEIEIDTNHAEAVAARSAPFNPQIAHGTLNHAQQGF